MKYLLGTALYILLNIVYIVAINGEFTINQVTLLPLVIESVFALAAFWVGDILVGRRSAK